MSQHSENDSDDDDCEYFLQPVSNQYNITEKIKEANQQLYKGEHLQRSTQPKVRFRDHQLVDYEPEDEADDDGTEIMERRSNSSNNSKKDDESSDDGYIDDETLEPSGDERLIIEAIEIEEVSEQIEILQVTTSSDNITEPSNEAMDEPNYEEDEFDEEADASKSASARSSASGKKTKSTKKIFRSKINPLNGDVDGSGEHIIRRTTKKDCCQYKETDEYKNKLPKYNGFYSHYGLSKDEYEQRMHRQQENEQFLHRRRSRHLEQKEFLAKENEQAFAKWLYKKMRNSMSRSNPTNMYDIKPSALMRKQRKQEQKRQRQTIQRQMETDEYDDVSVDEDDDDDEDVGEEEEEAEDDDESLQQLNTE